MYSELLKYDKTYGRMIDDYSAWHKGRKRFAVWVLEPNHPDYLVRHAEAQQHLSPFLLNDYARHCHITLATCGFLTAQKSEQDDYDRDAVAKAIDGLMALQLESVQAMVKNTLISYAIAPVFEVLDTQQHLAVLHETLRVKDDQYEPAPYFPHLTIGLYNAIWSTQVIVDELKKFPIEANIPLVMNTIKLVSYEPTVAGGALKDELIFDLATQSVIQYPDGF